MPHSFGPHGPTCDVDPTTRHDANVEHGDVVDDDEKDAQRAVRHLTDTEHVSVRSGVRKAEILKLLSKELMEKKGRWKHHKDQCKFRTWMSMRDNCFAKRIP